jgi:MFS transporter, PPP family, 3-phenylpropionic acid transporter
MIKFEATPQLIETLARVRPFLLLFVLLYAAFGAASPFMPALMSAKGLSSEQIGLIFGAATAIRLVSAPIAGRIADRTHSLRATLAVCCVACAIAVLGYLPATGFGLLLTVSLAHALALAPTTNLADALAVVNAHRQGFEYGWVRGAGSAAFILMSMLAGLAISGYGLTIIVILQAALMLATPLTLARVSPIQPAAAQAPINGAGFRTLLGLPVFRRVVLAAALILGSHSLHDTFSMIRWIEAGISAPTASMLWSLAVAAEVVVFFLVGPWLIERFGPARTIAFAAVAAALRWVISALTLDLLAIVLIQPLHGITFALLHLACMRLLAVSVPPQLAATAQAIYGTLGVGATTAVLTIVSGSLYARMGADAFVVMSGLCLAAVPVALSLQRLQSNERQISR